MTPEGKGHLEVEDRGAVLMSTGTGGRVALFDQTPQALQSLAKGGIGGEAVISNT